MTCVLSCILGGTVLALICVSAPTVARPAPTGDRDGLWQVVPAESFVGYRVRERLGFLPAPNDAVGRTSSIVGQVRITGVQLDSASFTTDLRTLKSDRTNRDGCVASRLGNQPQARFTLNKPIQLPDIADTREFSISARAKLRVHGVTRAVVFPLKARWTTDRFQVVGGLRVKLSDYRITKLRVGPVLSVSKFATIEVQLSFERR